MKCKYCESEDVRRDAWARWDPDVGEWVLKEVFPNDWCVDCDAETTIVEDPET